MFSVSIPVDSEMCEAKTDRFGGVLAWRLFLVESLYPAAAKIQTQKQQNFPLRN